MAPTCRLRTAGLALAATLSLVAASESQESTLPADVTPAMVTEGSNLFRGAGLCIACHGPTGAGGVGANLSDSTWIHSAGSYEEIIQQIVKGVSAEESKSGVMMPPKGGSNLSEAQIRAVAAYVWTLSHPAGP